MRNKKAATTKKKTGGRTKSPIPRGKRTTYIFESVEIENEFEYIRENLMGKPSFNNIMHSLVRGFIQENKHLLAHGNVEAS
jgi:hypothetical protein